MGKVGGTRAETAVPGRGWPGAVVTDLLAHPFATGAQSCLLVFRFALGTTRCSRMVYTKYLLAITAALAPRTAAVSRRVTPALQMNLSAPMRLNVHRIQAEKGPT